MAARSGSMIWRVSVGALSAAALTCVSLQPASAGIFERIFGGLSRAIEAPARLPANISAFADPFADMRSAPSQQAEFNPSRAFCVRTGDGFYFPLQSHAGVSAAEACHALCPASATKLYSGAPIDNAVASDGSRYADMDTAFRYRKQLVAGVTCNGRDQFGLAHVDVNTDPTLRPGDIVATKTGLVSFTGMKNQVADFAPLSGDRAVPKSTRERLSAVKIMPTARGTLTPVTMAAYAHAREDNRSAQLSR
jgi:Protein of unknown function (DUF2865)